MTRDDTDTFSGRERSHFASYKVIYQDEYKLKGGSDNSKETIRDTERGLETDQLPSTVSIPNEPPATEIIDKLTQALASRYLRREQRFYHIDKPYEPLSRRDVEQTFLHQAEEMFPNGLVTSAIMRSVYDVGIERKHTDRTRTIPVWGGSLACHPGNTERLIWQSSGTVCINTWKKPPYRTIAKSQASIEEFHVFLASLFPRPEERIMVTSWLAWSLQNEAKKPSWAILLYSREKGTGKSTFCDIVRYLFGQDNTVTQNSVDKLTSRFNKVPLLHRLVISEELNIRPDSPQSNQIKTYITDTTILTEGKGKEAERVPLNTCFLFTTNHLPTWLEENERRYYAVDTGHDGHASGKNASQFTELVQLVRKGMEKPEKIAALYEWLMQFETAKGFNANSLNSELHGTGLMKRLQGSSQQTNLAQLEEFLDKQQHNVITQTDVASYIAREFKVSSNSTRHMMMELGWHQYKVKWGGVDYSRVVWARPKYAVTEGNIYAPDGSVEALCDHLALAGSETK